MLHNQRPMLFIALLFIGMILWMEWVKFNQKNAPEGSAPQIGATAEQTQVPGVPKENEDASAVPTIPTQSEVIEHDSTVAEVTTENLPNAELIRVSTDLFEIDINTQGGSLDGAELIHHPISKGNTQQGFSLLKSNAEQSFVAQDGLLTIGHQAVHHTKIKYRFDKQSYDLGNQETITVPLYWQDADGVAYEKQFHFRRNSYVVDISYHITNNSSQAWQGYLYAQLEQRNPTIQSIGFGQLPSYTGGAIYTPEEKYEKIDFDSMEEEPLARKAVGGWVSMLQHYFVAVWLPQQQRNIQFYSSASRIGGQPIYRIGYKSLEPVRIEAGAEGQVAARAFIGPKEQSHLKQLQKEEDIKGLALTVDYGWLTFIADPLFITLNWIHSWVKNWGWAIILLTILIKLLFYPLSAASYKSMAGMRKLQPRLQTLKDRYKDDKQKLQVEMMALYKKEKINPMGGCLPILIQIPVFIALYYVLLESVEMRQAPFALWLQDLSAKDPYFILPVLMGASMWAQQKLNPAPMDDMQKKIMAVVPFVLTFLFATFPQGLVLYWVVNNLLSIAQQWLIYKQLGQA